MPAETLRQATILLSQTQQTAIFNSIHQSDVVSLESTRYLGPSANEYFIGLSRLTGNLAAAEELFDANDQVLEYAITGTDEYSLVYAHYQNIEPVEELISILYHHDLVVNWPMVHQQTGETPETKITVIGTSTGIQGATADLPSTVNISVEKIKHVHPSEDDEIAQLTDRQQALLKYAIQAGYYEVPRQTTHQELAESLNLSPGTVSDRLQRIERRVMKAYAQQLF
ncbi:helix-turn-helix domain-containing protein [Halomicrococcus sp. NG-SE-24]|uniref:helix-turn-helix domain-containing protein n=1 Tax=Halomicrococcus sp. NG-SE-24 TaxID=3436928 RepID=UPI003D984FAD